MAAFARWRKVKDVVAAEEATARPGDDLNTSSSNDGKYKLEFIIPRDDAKDVYKQNSPAAIQKLCEQPWRTPLDSEEANMMQMIGSDLDRNLSFEDIIGAPPKPSIPKEIQEQISRLPSWLQSMVTAKYPKIQQQYKDDTIKFFRAIGNRIDKQYRSRVRTGASTEEAYMIRGEGDRDYRDTDQLEFYKINDDKPHGIPVPVPQPNAPGGFTSTLTKSAIAVRVAHATGRWKKHAPQASGGSVQWKPTHVSRANLKLRSALQTRAAFTDLATVAEDEEMLHVDKKSFDSDEEEETTVTKKVDYWNAIFDQEETMAKAEKQVERDLTLHRKLTAEARIAKRRAKLEAEKSRKSCGKRVCGAVKAVGRHSQQHLFVSKRGKRRRKRILLTKGHFRDYSKLFNSECGSFKEPPKRLDRTYRWDDCFHNYCVALVSWFWFKCGIMAIIGLNAMVLAIETGDNSQQYSFYFEVIDNVFVAIYTVEFIVKIYANPYKYWRSGFNLFDFIILIISLTKNIVDWTNLADVDALRALLIVRALRILRGISLSKQLQVLVAALVETIRSHVLSVVILLVLILYVIAIIAFYFYGKDYPEAFGTVGRGMLNMLRVLTIDGWTDLRDALELRSDNYGTLFIIVCIVLGNFLFSNIFVAIIIMNISEATDNFRDKQKEQREMVVRLKKEKVFRRQKLDLRQLFARQRTSAFTDFFSIGAQFQKLLRHDDLVAMTDVVTSPLWIDSVYQSMLRANHTSNVLMNLHREMSDNLVEIYRHYKGNNLEFDTIRRGRFNRYMRIKAKLALIKNEMLKIRPDQGHVPIRVRLPDIGNPVTSDQQVNKS